jgi:alpha-beta hydrolase superfamily lysophospholipase
MPAISCVSQLRGNVFHGIIIGFACSILILVTGASAEARNPPVKTPRANAVNKSPEKTVPVADAPAAAVDAKKDAKSDKEKIPEPEEPVLTTSDGVRLVMTYYPGTRGRETVPVVLLHMAKGGRTDYTSLAKELQSQGFAVIVPDLRGHGDSTKQKVGGTEYTLSAAKLPVDQYKLMVDKDMYAVKEFLWEKNNAKEFNLNKLCVIGAEMGASVAMNFTALDAAGYGDSDRGPYYGPLQLGRFVKALVLLSPEISFKGLPLAPLPEDLRKNLPVLILVGKDDPKILGDAERVSKIFKRIPPKKDEDTTYFFRTLETKLQGTKLLEPKTLPTVPWILQFLRIRVVQTDDAKNWTWKTLKKPYE